MPSLATCSLFVKRSTKPLGAQRPHASRPHAMLDTAQSRGDAGGRPAAPPHASSPWARKTPHRERCHPRRRQRGSRLVRAALSVSKQLAPHSGALKRGIGPDNLTRAAA
jgi:hypothetical protein